MTKGKLTTTEMLKEVDIGIQQLRNYIKQDKLPATFVRGKFYATREAFDKFKQDYGFC